MVVAAAVAVLVAATAGAAEVATAEVVVTEAFLFKLGENIQHAFKIIKIKRNLRICGMRISRFNAVIDFLEPT